METIIGISVEDAKLLAAATKAASTDKTRPILSSVSFTWTLNGQPDDETVKLEVAATDSHILVSRTMSGTLIQGDDAGSGLVPAKPLAGAIGTVIKTIPKVRGTKNVQIVLTFPDAGNFKVSGSLPDSPSIPIVDTTYGSKFPEWRRFIDEQQTVADGFDGELPAFDPKLLIKLLQAAYPGKGKEVVSLQLTVRRDGSKLTPFGVKGDGVQGVIMPFRT